MANGYWQKMLRVDLTARKASVEDIAEDDLRNFIGGAGLGAEILRREVSAKIDPYSSENKVIFATGPVQGPMIPGSAKSALSAYLRLRILSPTPPPVLTGVRH